MNDTTTAPDNEPMRAVVDNYGDLSAKPDTIPEDLQPYVKQVLQMDSIRDVPGSVKQIGGVRPPLKLKVEALPPELQGEVYRQLERMPKMPPEDRAKYEGKLVAEVIQQQKGRIRGLAGVGPDALPFHRAQAQIAMDVRTLQEKRATYQTAVDDIAELRKANDPVTGELVAEPVYRLDPTKRANFQNAIADIDRQIRLLVDDEGKPGIEGKKRMDKALIESAQLLRQRNEQQAEEAEARQLAEQRLRTARIEARADTLTRMKVDRR
ncbi:MAG: hypothetical protein O9266_08095 [Porphyrobacter sp.]|nr:hypothetical protein [Porphyrobacter sp.]